MRSQTIFLIEHLQPDWLTSSEQWLYRVGLCSLVSISFGICYGFSSQLGLWIVQSAAITDFIPYFQDAIKMLLIYGPIVGLAVLFLPASIIPIETLNWSWRKATPGILQWVIFGVIVGLLGGLIFDVVESLLAGVLIRTPDETWWHWSITNLFPFDGVLGGIAGFVFGLTTGFQGFEIEAKTVPNQAIWRSARSSLQFSGIGALVGGTAGSLSSYLSGLGSLNGLINGLFVGLVMGLIGAGGLPCLKHLALRLLLFWRGYLPWNVRQFLDYSAEKVFLQKVGGGYIFVHRLLLEHFASAPTHK